jgi:hypothetical protein
MQQAHEATYQLAHFFVREVTATMVRHFSHHRHGGFASGFAVEKHDVGRSWPFAYLAECHMVWTATHRYSFRLFVV